MVKNRLECTTADAAPLHSKLLLLPLPQQQEGNIGFRRLGHSI